MNSSKKEKITKEILKGDVELYEYKNKKLPDFIKDKKEVSIFINKKNNLKEENLIRKYDNLSEIYRSNAKTCFLDGKAKRVLLAKFPEHCKYILVRFNFDKNLFISLPGLVRRLLKKKINLLGILNLKEGERNTKWIVLSTIKNSKKTTGDFTLSKEIGIQGLLNYLKNEDINYVVLRFFDNLPKLHREGGDLDILVSDEDKEKLSNFLNNNHGEIPIGIFSVSDPSFANITYYPPPIARKILNNPIEGPANSKIPSKKNAFLSLAYHILYHKGYDSGVPSLINNQKVNKNPKNDYQLKLSKMANELNIDIEINMESLDEYLEKEGWRPKLDTLAKLGFRNKWIWERFFSEKTEEEIGLGVFILKEKVLKNNLQDKIIGSIEKEGFIVISKKELGNKEKKYASEHLRGGNWINQSLNNDFMPAMVLVVLDPYGGHIPIEYIEEGKGGRMRTLKERVRKEYDDHKISLIHSTDNTHESWEYIDVCFSKKEKEKIEEEIPKNIRKNKSNNLKRSLKLIPYFVKSFIIKVKSIIIKKILN